MTLLALTIAAGALLSSGIYLILRRSVGKLAMGLVLLTHAANLIIFIAGGGAEGGAVPILSEDATATLENTSDPLPQAFILTAIVINFGILSFVAALLSQSAPLTPHDDLEEIREPER